jgi:hypothetical protein
MSADTPLPKANNRLPPTTPLSPSPESTYSGPPRRCTISEWAAASFGSCTTPVTLRQSGVAAESNDLEIPILILIDDQEPL